MYRVLESAIFIKNFFIYRKYIRNMIDLELDLQHYDELDTINNEENLLDN